MVNNSTDARPNAGKALQGLVFSFLVCAALLVVLYAVTGCSPIYVFEAAVTESKILIAREDIKTLIDSDSSTETEKSKLALVLEARAFSETIGLTPGKTFTKYSRVDRDVLAWVLLGSKPDSFSLYTWWFPFVGSVPYKGYFSLDDAKEGAEFLKDRGYEIWIRGTDAFSTLGWFNDPVLSTILKNKNARIANTVIHETLHRTVWIPGHVDFNESAANFVGLQGAVQFFEKRSAECQSNTACADAANADLKEARDELQREVQFAAIIEKLFEELQKLYESKVSREEKLDKRKEIFDAHMKGLRAAFPTMKALQVINNAEIIQYKLYLTGLGLFQQLYGACGGDWHSFISVLNIVKKKAHNERLFDPFRFLGGRLDKGAGACAAEEESK